MAHQNGSNNRLLPVNNLVHPEDVTVCLGGQIEASSRRSDHDNQPLREIHRTDHSRTQIKGRYSHQKRRRFVPWLPLAVFLLLLPIEAQPSEVELPPLLDSDDIAYFFERNDLEGLHWALSSVFAASERMPQRQSAAVPLPQQLVARGGGSTYTTAYKLQMDLEQAEYLSQQLKETQPELAAYFREKVAPIYRKVLQNIPALEDLQRTNGLYAFRPPDWEAGIAAAYNKALYLQPLEDDDVTPLDDNSRTPLLNPALDTQTIQQEWFGETTDTTTQANSNTGIVVIDDILSPEALHNIRKVLLESTVWYQTKMPAVYGGYAGAYLDDGLHHKILLQLSMELFQALPRIMKGNPLRYLWAYKYDAEFTSGINLHADQAAVNVNLWITPDESNLDPTSGGLVVFTSKPPPNWSFEEYNTHPDKVVEELLRPTNFANVTIPHKQNRAVLFDSALFHQTDVYKFKKGYTNRRINLTLLYGTIQTQQQQQQQQQENVGKTEL